MIVVRLGSAINVDVSGDLCIFHKTNVQSITSDVLMIIYSYLIHMRRLIDMSEITKEQIDEILHKNTLIVGENIPNELVEQIANNVEHMSEQDKNIQQFSIYLASTTVAVQAMTEIMKNTLYELLCDKES